jgi:hypothetical protein
MGKLSTRKTLLGVFKVPSRPISGAGSGCDGSRPRARGERLIVAGAGSARGREAPRKTRVQQSASSGLEGLRDACPSSPHCVEARCQMRVARAGDHVNLLIR